MTAKEKAEELVRRMNQSMMPHGMDKTDSKLCALIAVDEIIKTHEHNGVLIGLGGYDSNSTIKYWQQVKENINNL